MWQWTSGCASSATTPHRLGHAIVFAQGRRELIVDAPAVVVRYFPDYRAL
jgi:hypothetical protein